MVTSPRTAGHGAWQSPITAAQVAAADGRPGWVELHGDDVLFTRPIPAQDGRVSLSRWRDGEVTEVLDQPWSVRNRLHEYGGRPWTVVGDTAVFTNWADQRIYAVDLTGGTPTPITAEPERRHGLRYGDLVAGVGDTVWCVRETVTGDAPTDIERHLVSVPLTGGEPTVITGSHHFMTAPKPNADGTRIAWLGWEHPAMPWNGTELCVAELFADGRAGEHRVVAGGPREAVCQVEWDGEDLLALTDPGGWWNLHRIGPDGTSRNLAPCDAEIGGPLWQPGMRWFTRLSGGRVAVVRSGRLSVVDETAGTITDVPGLEELPTFVPALSADGNTVYGVAAGPRRKHAVVAVDVTGDVRALTPQPADLPPAEYLPVPVERVFTDADGHRIPAFVYPPTNPDFVAPQGELPPYVVHVHGGPTGASSPVLDLNFAYLTSRGIGVVAVNYGGSAGYGRAFRERLDEQWGVVDVEDCATVINQLAAEGTADAGRLAIRGGSAGGWTSAVAIATTKTYRCATVMFPVIDLFRFATADTHDFESQYTFGLVGTLPEHEQRYHDRSPVNHVDTIAGPVLMLQGLDDPVCPPDQAEAFITAMDGTGIPHAYLAFEGEQHGFRMAPNMIAATEAELSFYGQVFGFTVDVAQVELRT